jgi:hypothetical protein
VRSCLIETELALPEAVPAQDVVRATAPVKAALVASAAEGLDAADVDVDWVAALVMYQIRITPG